MGRARLVLHKEENREEAIEWVRKAPLGSRLDFKGPARTLEQNDRMWAMLTDIVKQHKTVNGTRYSTDEWKIMFLEALGREQDLLPKLDGSGFFATGYSSSNLSIPEMSDLIEFMFAWGAENDVRWSDPALESYTRMMR